ncbi:MAG: thiamine-binding protein [Geodermatophilales bacterium]|nr:thiamine-binding protein [Geodermatophilales bacterium]
MTVIAEIQVAPTPAGTPADPHAHVEAAIAVIQASGLRYEVGALGTTLEGDADEVWATLRAAHEAMLAAGATSGLSHLKVASVSRSMDSLTHKFR